MDDRCDREGSFECGLELAQSISAITSRLGRGGGSGSRVELEITAREHHHLQRKLERIPPRIQVSLCCIRLYEGTCHLSQG